jgi:hypothetical protein
MSAILAVCSAGDDGGQHGIRRFACPRRVASPNGGRPRFHRGVGDALARLLRLWGRPLIPVSTEDDAWGGSERQRGRRGGRRRCPLQSTGAVMQSARRRPESSSHVRPLRVEAGLVHRYAAPLGRLLIRTVLTGEQDGDRRWRNLGRRVSLRLGPGPWMDTEPHDASGCLLRPPGGWVADGPWLCCHGGTVTHHSGGPVEGTLNVLSTIPACDTRGQRVFTSTSPAACSSFDQPSAAATISASSAHSSPTAHTCDSAPRRAHMPAWRCRSLARESNTRTARSPPHASAPVHS